MRQITGLSNPDVGIDIQAFYDEYPPSTDLIIYQKVEGAFFAVKEGVVLEVLARNAETGGYNRMEPLKHMLIEQNKIIEWKNSEMYKYYKDQTEKQNLN